MLKAILVVGTIFVCLFLVIGGVAGTILLSAGIVRYIAPDPVEVNQATPFHMRVVALAQSLRSRPGEDEAQDARNTSLAIREWALKCELAKVGSDAIARSVDPKDPVFPRLARTVNTIYDYRVSYAKAIDSTFSLFEWTAVLGIIIGLGTTIFAGIRGDDAIVTNNWKSSVRILAIVFPALGTAVSAYAALYGARDELIRFSQSVIALQQVQGEVLIALERESCPKDESSRDKIVKMFDDWDDKVNRQRPATVAARTAARLKGSGL